MGRAGDACRDDTCPESGGQLSYNPQHRNCLSRRPIRARRCCMTTDGLQSEPQSALPDNAARRIVAGLPETNPDGRSCRSETVRRTAQHLAQHSETDLFRKGGGVDPGAIRGVIRLSLYEAVSKAAEES